MRSNNVFRDASIISREETKKALNGLSAKEVFSAPETQIHATKMAQQMLGTQLISVNVDYDKYGGNIGYTTGRYIYINPAHPVVAASAELVDQIRACFGVLFHEISHCIYTDFGAFNIVMDELSNGRMLFGFSAAASPEEQQAQEEISLALTHPAARAFLFDLFKDLFNIVIDTHDENKIIARYHGYTEQSIMRLRLQMQTQTFSYDKHRRRVNTGKMSVLSLLVNLVFQIARFGDVYVEDRKKAEKDEVFLAAMALRPVIETAVSTDELETLCQMVWKIICGMWNLVKDDWDQRSNESKPQSAPDASQSQPQPDGSGQQGSGQSDGSQRDSGDAGSGGDKSDSNNEKGADRTKSSSGGNDNSQRNSGDESGAGNDRGDSTKDASGDKAKDDGSENGNSVSENGGGDDDKSTSTSSFEELLQRLTEKELKEIENELSDILKNIRSEMPKDTNSVKAGTSDANSQSAAAPDLSDKLLSDIAKRIGEENAEKRMSEELIVISKQTGFNACHDGIPYKVTRAKLKADSEYIYDVVANRQKPVLRMLLRQMRSAIRNMSVGESKRHQIVGQRLRAEDTYRLDGLCFETKKMVKNPEIAICVCVDQSGSMSSSARLLSAQATSVLLYDFCDAMNIPCMICGHNTSHGANVDFYIYSDFRKQKNDRYIVAEGLTHTSGCNRDGLALQIASNLLSKRPEPVKLLMVINDGQPNHHILRNTGTTSVESFYCGEVAEEDIRSIVKKNKRNGISTIAFAIGEDKERIKAIYGENFIDVSDPTNLPKKLSNVVKRKVMESMS